MKFISLILISLSSLIAQATTFKCVGTEPFWNAQINLSTGMAKISSAEMLEGSSIQTEIKQAVGTSGNYAFTAKGKYTTFAVVENSTCSDGMSEDKYTHSVLMINDVNAAPLFGCCKE